MPSKVGAIIVTLLLLAAPARAHHVREGNVRFKVTCNWSHVLPDDPIVWPNQPGASHLHDFFGNQGVDAYTITYASLRADSTTCNDLEDEAGYWYPEVRANGVRVAPGRNANYYRLGEKHPPIYPYPAGLKVVAGYPDTGRAGWKCGETGGTQAMPPASCSGNDLVMSVEFPDCWDGVNLDSPDHQSHMAYSVDGGDAHVCPASHPVQVPELTTFVHYITSKRPITLSSGQAITAHGDFFNGWGEARLQNRVDVCLNGFKRCDSGG